MRSIKAFISLQINILTINSHVIDVDIAWAQNYSLTDRFNFAPINRVVRNGWFERSNGWFRYVDFFTRIHSLRFERGHSIERKRLNVISSDLRPNVHELLQRKLTLHVLSPTLSDVTSCYKPEAMRSLQNWKYHILRTIRTI